MNADRAIAAVNSETRRCFCCSREFLLVTGRSGAGKSTFLRLLNGLVPHFTGGTLTGRVVVDGRDTARYKPRELADVVGGEGRRRVSAAVAGYLGSIGNASCAPSANFHGWNAADGFPETGLDTKGGSVWALFFDVAG